MLDQVLAKIRRHIPPKLFNALNPAYHWILAFTAALIYRFPSREIKVIAVTGTKGKSSTVEILNTILVTAGYRTALSDTIRLKVDQNSEPNMHKMSMPGRFFAQRLLRKAVESGCQYFIMEMTSQGSLLYRHRFIELDALVFTNLSPEHIEAHGSYENYKDSKMSIARNMTKSSKPNKTIIANTDDVEGAKFLECKADRKIPYGLRDVEPYEINKEGLEFTLGDKKVSSHLSGLFNLYNIVAAIKAAQSQGVADEKIIEAIENVRGIPGRVEKIEVELPGLISMSDPLYAKRNFSVIVDYAHTPDSLEKLYKLFPTSRNICILGGTGGGRDAWKRAEMGKIADNYCDEIILTNEDPYDEDPRVIVHDVALGIRKKKPMIIMDRREAIREAIRRAKTGDTILITGKGTDPFIMGPNNSKIPWSDSGIVREEIERSKQ